MSMVVCGKLLFAQHHLLHKEVTLNEAQYQYRLIKKVEKLLPGCFILRNDPRHIQGVPDVLILYKNKWAMLEVKLAGDANIQPNQEYYVGLLNDMSFASFINPQNEEEILGDLQHAFGLARETRVS
jgi:hypothetical protein